MTYFSLKTANYAERWLVCMYESKDFVQFSLTGRRPTSAALRKQAELRCEASMMDHPAVKLALCRGLRRQLGDKESPVWEHISSSHRSSLPPRQEVFTCQTTDRGMETGEGNTEQFCRFSSHLWAIETAKGKSPLSFTRIKKTNGVELCFRKKISL